MCNRKKDPEIQSFKDKIRVLEEDRELEKQKIGIEKVKTVLTVFTTIGTLASALYLFLNFNQGQERLITDRFAKSTELLGHTDQAVRIGGIYSLERIANDSPKDQWTIMEVLSAHVRRNSPIATKIEDNKPVNIEVQAALTVIGRRNSQHDNVEDPAKRKRLDLTGSNLKKANLGDADLSYSNLDGSILLDVNLTDANLTKAVLADANLTKVEFNGTKLTEAYLANADLTGAYLSSVDDLAGAILIDANLTGAFFNYTDFANIDLTGANLTGAILYPSKTEIDSRGNAHAVLNDSNRYKSLNLKAIKSACFWEEAIYTEPTFDETQKKWVAIDQGSNQLMIDKIIQDKASKPQTLPDCTESRSPYSNQIH
jgi:hypothetical protein